MLGITLQWSCIPFTEVAEPLGSNADLTIFLALKEMNFLVCLIFELMSRLQHLFSFLTSRHTYNLGNLLANSIYVRSATYAGFLDLLPGLTQYQRSTYMNLYQLKVSSKI